MSAKAAEELQNVLSAYLADLIDLIIGSGGDVLRLAGVRGSRGTITRCGSCWYGALPLTCVVVPANACCRTPSLRCSVKRAAFPALPLALELELELVVTQGRVQTVPVAVEPRFRATLCSEQCIVHFGVCASCTGSASWVTPCDCTLRCPRGQCWATTLVAWAAGGSTSCVGPRLPSWVQRSTRPVSCGVVA